MAEVIYWGKCDNCGKKEVLLTPFIHTGEDVTGYACPICSPKWKDALEREQVPRVLGDKLQAAIEAKKPKP